MRVVFFGTGSFGIPALESLVRSRHGVVGVVTGPDKPAGRGRPLQPTPIRKAAEEFSLPVLAPVHFADPLFLKDLSSWKPDVGVVVAFRILPSRISELPSLGTLNIHPSLLPTYRGPAPIHWALIRGERETGVTVFRITKKVDAGGVLLQRRVQILPDETAGELAARLAPMGGEMIVEALDGLEQGTLEPIPQDENRATRAPKLCKADGKINWTVPASMVHNLIRGVTPWPGAFTTVAGKKLKLFRSSVLPGSGNPGEVLKSDGMLVIACGSDALAIGEVQIEGKKTLKSADFLRGFQLAKGTILGQ